LGSRICLKNEINSEAGHLPKVSCLKRKVLKGQNFLFDLPIIEHIFQHKLYLLRAKAMQNMLKLLIIYLCYRPSLSFTVNAA
jgi:hypothetical protein